VFRRSHDSVGSIRGGRHSAKGSTANEVGPEVLKSPRQAVNFAFNDPPQLRAKLCVVIAIVITEELNPNAAYLFNLLPDPIEVISPAPRV
jgi:hypothetical protein